MARVNGGHRRKRKTTNRRTVASGPKPPKDPTVRSFKATRRAKPATTPKRAAPKAARPAAGVSAEDRAKYAKRRYKIAKTWEGERKMEEQRREVSRQKKERAAAKPAGRLTKRHSAAASQASLRLAPKKRARKPTETKAERGARLRSKARPRTGTSGGARQKPGPPRAWQEQAARSRGKIEAGHAAMVAGGGSAVQMKRAAQRSIRRLAMTEEGRKKLLARAKKRKKKAET